MAPSVPADVRKPHVPVFSPNPGFVHTHMVRCCVGTQVNYTELLGMLLNVGASPMGGAPRGSVLGYALELGITDAVHMLIPKASCGMVHA